MKTKAISRGVRDDHPLFDSVSLFDLEPPQSWFCAGKKKILPPLFITFLEVSQHRQCERKLGSNSGFNFTKSVHDGMSPNEFQQDRKTNTYLVFDVSMVCLLQPRSKNDRVISIAHISKQRSRRVAGVFCQGELGHKHPQQMCI